MGGSRNETIADCGLRNGNVSADRRAPLDRPTVALVRVAAALGEGKIDVLRDRFGAARAAGYGRAYHKLLLNLRALHPALEDLVLVDAYGKVIGRPGLDLQRRELCTVAAIAVLGAAQQLHSHLRGALNTGASREEVEAV